MGDAAAVSGGTLFFSTSLYRTAHLPRPPQTHLSSRAKSDTIRVTAPVSRAGSHLMTHENRSRTLPLGPLLAAFRSSRESAQVARPALTVQFLDTATTDELSGAIHAAAERALPVSFHDALIANRVRFLRHA